MEEKDRLPSHNVAKASAPTSLDPQVINQLSAFLSFFFFALHLGRMKDFDTEMQRFRKRGV